MPSKITSFFTIITIATLILPAVMAAIPLKGEQVDPFSGLASDIDDMIYGTRSSDPTSYSVDPDSSLFFADDTEPAVAGEDTTKAVAWKELAPVEGATFVYFDETSYIDDYAFMASVPSSVFASGDNLYAHPVLFYEEPIEGQNNVRALNASQGVHYFMEDWYTYCENSLDFVNYINVPEETRTELSEKYTTGKNLTINSNDPYSLASKIALQSWESSDSAVVVPIHKDFDAMEKETTGMVGGNITSQEIVSIHFEGNKYPNPVEPNVHDFEVPLGYRYVTAHLTWTWMGQETMPDGSSATERGKDLDLQLYDAQLGEVVASEFWNVIEGDLYRPYMPPEEIANTYAYHNGTWSATVTYMPTKGVGNDIEGQFARADYDIHIEQYSGANFDIPEEVGYKAEDAVFTLTWGGNENLGLVIIDPTGAELASSVTDEQGSRAISVKQLGAGRYSFAVIDLDGTGGDIPFELTYSWTQREPEKKGVDLAAAANGAVLASIKNAPLLYMETDGLPGDTKDALDTLGVTKVLLVNPADHDVSGEFNYRAFWDRIEVDEIDSFKSLYGIIRSSTDENDIVFTTADPWTSWLPGQGINGNVDHEKATYLGPAALAGAFHGAPVLVTDVHPELSSPNAWHNEFWLQAYDLRLPPSIASMYLTGTSVYDFLGEMGLDEGLLADGSNDVEESGIIDDMNIMDESESILTIAGQFDIGQGWDRMLVGKAVPGRIIGTPVDAAYWVDRSALYPAIIYANPAVDPSIDPKNGMRVTGSSSRWTGVDYVVNPEQEIPVEFPVLDSWVSYQHRFNERASIYWGCDYTGPSGITPGKTESGNPIDIGNSNYYDDGKAYYPDMTVSEVVPFYSEKAGYDTVYATSFDRTMENLNDGALIWFEVMHGGHDHYEESGLVGFWNSDGRTWRDIPIPAQIEENPWRGYEKGGATEEGVGDTGPDTITMSKQAGADLVPASQLPGTLYENHDGVIIAIAEQVTQSTYYTGYDFDDALDNVHSVGMNAGSCLIADTYLHLTMVRHGSSFQVIDPWLTSWYSAFAMEMFIRDIALGKTIGEAYANGIHHVGIEYLTEQWWWDIFENVVYFGDPDLRVYTPEYHWERPVSVSLDSDVDGHVSEATSHPNEISSSYVYNYLLIGVAVVAVGAVFWRIRKKKDGDFEMVDDSDVEWE